MLLLQSKNFSRSSKARTQCDVILLGVSLGAEADAGVDDLDIALAQRVVDHPLVLLNLQRATNIRGQFLNKVDRLRQSVTHFLSLEIGIQFLPAIDYFLHQRKQTNFKIKVN